MSSRTSALVTATILRFQAEAGMYGDVCEIGVYEGRFLIPMAMSLQQGEKAVGIDLFDWPDAGVKDRLVNNLASAGVLARVELLVADSRRLPLDEIPGGRRRYRLTHIDGDHTWSSITADLRLALKWSEPWGVICLDDMLSPTYPDLFVAVHAELQRAVGWKVFCIVDRENIVAAAKFFVCREELFDFYKERLAAAFQPIIWTMGGRFSDHVALVLSIEGLASRRISTL